MSQTHYKTVEKIHVILSVVSGLKFLKNKKIVLIEPQNAYALYTVLGKLLCKSN